MSAVTAALCWILLFVGVFLFVCADQKNITAESGQDVTLTCRAPNNKIIVLEWSRADLGDEYVLVYRDGQFLTDNHYLSFYNRVDLQDRQMKDGDVSLILKNVTINDTGTYECRVFREEPRSWQLISIIHLHVVDPPGQTGGQEKDGPVRLIVGLTVPSVLIFIVVVVVVAVVGFFKCRKKKLNPADPHEAEHLQHLQPEYQKSITAESGQHVTLTCRAPNNNIRVVEWSRADLRDKYVLLYQDDHFDPHNQHPSFKNRVDLQDKQMKDGDVSLILKDVTINDAGTYECRVVQRGTNRRNRAHLKTEPISVIKLIVDPPDQKNITAEP